HHLGEAEPDELGVDHQVADPDVGQEPAVTVARLHVHLEPHAPALEQAAIDITRFASARFLAARGMVQLRRVDPDVAHALDAIAQADVNGVAIHDPDHGALENGWRA